MREIREGGHGPSVTDIVMLIIALFIASILYSYVIDPWLGNMCPPPPEATWTACHDTRWLGCMALSYMVTMILFVLSYTFLSIAVDMIRKRREKRRRRGVSHRGW